MSATHEVPLARTIEAARRIVTTLDGCVLGQRRSIETLVAAYMAGGHVLLEGVPGIGKTLLARAFAACLGVHFTRVQFTPDLMPSDVIGTNVFEGASGGFRLVRGPVFTEVLMADEINRTPPKTQSALLEAMQERQVSIDGVSHPLHPGFFVIATSNPVEFEGTYPLPEAQLDRFLARVGMGLPDHEAEIELYRRAVGGRLAGWTGSARLPEAVVAPGETDDLRTASAHAHVAEELLDYVGRLAVAVRTSPHVELGISPRGALALLETARAAALLDGREYVVPDDFKRLLGACWGHRLLLTAESELEGQTVERILDEVAARVEVPH